MLQRSRHRWITVLSAGIVVGGLSLWAGIEDLPVIDSLHDPVAEHVDQDELVAMVRGGQTHEAFIEAFEDGDELFETNFNALDGVGANVGQKAFVSRRVPRADLDGPGQWARHTPARTTGPNAISCNACHIQLFDDGAGSAVANVHRDPLHSGEMRRFIQRNTPHLFAPGALQRLAEEMTVELLAVRDTARDMACASGILRAAAADGQGDPVRPDQCAADARRALPGRLRQHPRHRRRQRSGRQTVPVEGRIHVVAQLQSRRRSQRARHAARRDRPATASTATSTASPTR